jgi:GTP-binding protein HflX
VGFVRKLPHRLVEAFKATLEEAVMSTFLIHVIDAASPEALAHHATTMQVLRELGADKKNIVTVFNKMDLVPDASQLAHLRGQFPNAFFISIHTGEGVDALLHRLQEMARPETVRLSLLLPHTRYDLVSQLHKAGRVYSENYTEHGIEAEASIPARLAGAFRPFAVA